MKRIKALSLLIAFLFCLPLILTSCNQTNAEKIASYKLFDIMNADWKMKKSAVINTFKDVQYMGNYDGEKSKFGFLVTTAIPDSSNTEDAATISTLVTRVYNTDIDQSVATLNNTTTTEVNGDSKKITTKINYVDIISSDYFAVITTTSTGSSISAYNTSAYFGCPLSESYEYSLTIYDALGAIKAIYYNDELHALCGDNLSNFDRVYGGSDSSSIRHYYKSAEDFLADVPEGLDLYSIGGKIYRFDSKLKSTLVRDYGLASKPSLANMKKIGYSYLEYVDGVYTVYDTELRYMFDYTIPGYAEGNAFLLANGNLLVQYLTQLDQSEKKYDVREDADCKYDLVTVLVNSDGAKELEGVNYLIVDVKPSVADENGKKIYADNVDNLAFTYPIGDNKMIDSSYSNKELVVIANDGTLKAKVTVEGNVASFPMQYNESNYAIMLADGNYAIYNKHGDKINVLTADAMNADKIAGDYVILNNVIYNSKGEKVYSIDENHAVAEKCGNTVVIKKYSTTATEIGIFVDGVVKNIGLIAKEDMNSTISGFDFSSAGYYCTYDRQTNKYSYYNEKGGLIVSFDRALEQIVATDSYLIMRDSINNIFYKFAFAQ